MDGVDADRSGYIAYTEFIAAALDRQLYSEESICWQAFSAFDRDCDGGISMQDLKAVLATDGLSTGVALERLMQETDANGDGEIDFKEFLAAMRGAGAHTNGLPAMISDVEEVGIYQ